MTEKETLLYIIKQKGGCGNIFCKKCLFYKPKLNKYSSGFCEPLASSENVILSILDSKFDSRFDAAIKEYIERYSYISLVEELL